MINLGATVYIAHIKESNEQAEQAFALPNCKLEKVTHICTHTLGIVLIYTQWNPHRCCSLCTAALLFSWEEDCIKLSNLGKETSVNDEIHVLKE